MANDLCGSCSKRNKCRSLCRKAEAYVSQDDKEEPWQDITFKEEIDAYAQQMPPGLSTCEAMLQNYFIDRMEIPEIAERYFVSRQYTYRIIKKYKAIIIKNIKKSVDSSS